MVITEFVKFKALETTTEEQLISKADMNINGFHKKQDGFIDAELVKNVDENAWYFLFHYENMEKIHAAGKKLRESKEFGEFVPLIIPESISATFCYSLKEW